MKRSAKQVQVSTVLWLTVVAARDSATLFVEGETCWSNNICVVGLISVLYVSGCHGIMNKSMLHYSPLFNFASHVGLNSLKAGLQWSQEIPRCQWPPSCHMQQTLNFFLDSSSAADVSGSPHWICLYFCDTSFSSYICLFLMGSFQQPLKCYFQGFAFGLIVFPPISSPWCIPLFSWFHLPSILVILNSRFTLNHQENLNNLFSSEI